MNQSSSNISDLTIYAQIPQYISLGIAQLFGVLTGMEFAYYIAPRSAKCLFMYLYIVSRPIACYILDGYMHYLSKPSSKMDFNVSINIQ